MKRFVIVIFFMLSVIAIVQIDDIHSMLCKHVYGNKYDAYRISHQIPILPKNWKGQFIDDAYLSYRPKLRENNEIYYGKDVQFAYFFKIVKETDYYQGQIANKPAFIKKIYFYKSGTKYYRLFTSKQTIPDVVYDGGRFIPQKPADSLINTWLSSQ